MWTTNFETIGRQIQWGLTTHTHTLTHIDTMDVAAFGVFLVMNGRCAGVPWPMCAFAVYYYSSQISMCVCVCVPKPCVRVPAQPNIIISSLNLSRRPSTGQARGVWRAASREPASPDATNP